MLIFPQSSTIGKARQGSLRPHGVHGLVQADDPNTPLPAQALSTNARLLLNKLVLSHLDGVQDGRVGLVPGPEQGLELLWRATEDDAADRHERTILNGHSKHGVLLRELEGNLEFVAARLGLRADEAVKQVSMCVFRNESRRNLHVKLKERVSNVDFTRVEISLGKGRNLGNLNACH